MADDGYDSDEFETELNADSEIDEVLLDIRGCQKDFRDLRGESSP